MNAQYEVKAGTMLTYYCEADDAFLNYKKNMSIRKMWEYLELKSPKSIKKKKVECDEQVICDIQVDHK